VNLPPGGGDRPASRTTTRPSLRDRPRLVPIAAGTVALLVLVLVGLSPVVPGLTLHRVRADRAQPGGSPGTARTGLTAAPGAPGAPGAAVRLDQNVVEQVARLLDQRAEAVLDGDRRLWLSTLDPGNPDFVHQQAALFDRLRLLPLKRWSYGGVTSRPDPASGGTTRLVDVRLSYRLAADTRDVVREQHLVARRWGTGWVLSGERADQQRDVWDLGPIAVARGARSLVIGSTSQRGVLQRFAQETDAAAHRVDAAWGTRWPRTVVVVVPADLRAMATVLGARSPGGLNQVAAITFGDLGGGQAAGSADRVVINAAAFSAFGPLGRRVVLTHEVTHVATRATTVADVPMWLQEGFADYVAYRGTGLSRGVIADDLLRLVRAGKGPQHLPDAQDFDPSRSRIAPAYAGAWLAMDLIARTGGPREVVAFYREAAGINPAADGELGVQAAAGGNAAGAPAAVQGLSQVGVEEGTPVPSPSSSDGATTRSAFHDVLGTDQAGFERRWRAYLAAVARDDG